MVALIKQVNIDYEEYFVIDGMLKQFGCYKVYCGLYKLHEVVVFSYYNELMKFYHNILLECTAIYFTKKGLPIYKFIRYRQASKTEAYTRFKNDHLNTNIYI